MYNLKRQVDFKLSKTIKKKLYFPKTYQIPIQLLFFKNVEKQYSQNVQDLCSKCDYKIYIGFDYICLT